jgi:5-methylcytosine-specific restriction protein B
VQFHPSCAYEDFVEGIRPVVNEGSNPTYGVRKGVFLSLVELKLSGRAEKAPEEKFFIMIVS